MLYFFVTFLTRLENKVSLVYTYVTAAVRSLSSAWVLPMKTFFKQGCTVPTIPVSIQKVAQGFQHVAAQASAICPAVLLLTLLAFTLIPARASPAIQDHSNDCGIYRLEQDTVMAASCLLCWEDKRVASVPCDVMPCAVRGDSDSSGILAQCAAGNRSLASLAAE